MTQKNLKQLLNSHPIPAVPNGLESRVLAAVHVEQQRELIWWRRFHQVSLVGLATTLLSSLAFVAYTVGQTSAQTIVETLLVNRDAVPLQDASLALLETLPLGGITMAFVTAALFCFLLSVRLPKQKLNFSTPAHLPSVV